MARIYTGFSCFEVNNYKMEDLPLLPGHRFSDVTVCVTYRSTGRVNF